MYLFSLHVPWSYDHFDIHCIVDIYIYIYISSPLSYMCCFLSIFIHMFLLVYNLSMFHT